MSRTVTSRSARRTLMVSPSIGATTVAGSPGGGPPPAAAPRADRSATDAPRARTDARTATLTTSVDARARGARDMGPSWITGRAGQLVVPVVSVLAGWGLALA